MMKTAPYEYYHVFNRAVSKQTIFHDRADYLRFLFLVLYFQSPEKIQNISRAMLDFVQHPVLNIAAEIINKRNVELISFCIMPNHFHLLVKDVGENSLSSYMQRVLNAYSKYYNIRYQKSGHVFQGPYKIVHVDSDEQLKYLSAYIHRNPRELPQWKDKYESYPWSSYLDTIGNNRWGDLVVPKILLEDGASEYQNFVRTSPAKLGEFEIV